MNAEEAEANRYLEECKASQKEKTDEIEAKLTK